LVRRGSGSKVRAMDDAASLQFGRFRLDPIRRVLLADGAPVAISARGFEMLAFLIRHRDRVVSRDELAAHVWRGVTVGDNNLPVQMSNLRRALAGHAGGDALIVTLPGQGYRFVGNAGDVPPPIVAAPGRRGGRYARMAAVAAACAALALAGGAVAVWRSPSEPVGGGSGAGRAAARPFTPPPHSVAVLAFANLSGDPNEVFLSEGFADELIDCLGRIAGLRIAARVSSFSFEGESATVGEIARQLNVGTILEGSVRRDGARLRITTQLIDGTTGFQIWSEHYDRSQGDVLQMQADIAKAVASSLQVALLNDDVPRLTTGGTTSPKARDAYLRGLEAGYRHGGPDHREELAALDAAIAIDPNFAQARAKRAFDLVDIVEYGSLPDAAAGRRVLDDAWTEAKRAVSIAPDMARAHLALGQIMLDRLDFAGAAAAFRRGHQLAPGDAWTDMSLANLETFLGHPEAGIEAGERAASLDPINPALYLDLVQIYFFARRYGDALTALRHAQQFGDYGTVRGMGLRGFIALMAHDAEAARTACATQRDTLETECLILADYALGRNGEATALFGKLRAGAGDDAAYVYAEIYAQWGQQDEALRWLERAYALRDVGLVMLRVDPFLDPIRGTAAFKDIEHRLNFPA
jgi:serine/threonine-protein kinase